MSRRRLGNELKQLRDDAGLTLDQAADALECSSSKVSRLETGKGLPKQRDIRDLVRLYKAEASLDRLLRLARAGATAGWWQQYTPILTSEPFVLDGADRYAALEFDATRITCFDGAVFHGLLQCPDYARLILERAAAHLDAGEMAQLLEFRSRRQESLSRSESPLELYQVIDESVLVRLVRGHRELARRQIEFVLREMERSNVEVGLLPFDAGFMRATQGSFAVIEFADSRDQDVVVVESHAGVSYLDGDFGVETYKAVFEDTRQVALTSTETYSELERTLSTL
ncbi:helix-turn-helix transcriptional regulator [Pseudonocardia ailaonensis]|uniref:Helix-turn-helix transcriptional regulator n=1 Tax=Pseudonocardia ailaonensis TaxID=367279 RepID=A0ABN2NKF8_9PSEU